MADRRRRRHRWRTFLLVLGVGAPAHALLTWPLGRAVLLFCGGVAVAFVAEAAVVAAGLLHHRLGPRVAGVPLPVLLAWPAVVYVWLELSSLVASGVRAVALAAALATLADAVVDTYGVRAGVWAYPDHPLSEPRSRGVPWWNFAGWLTVSFVTALLPLLG